jgi:heme A synthase
LVLLLLLLLLLRGAAAAAAAAAAACRDAAGCRAGFLVPSKEFLEEQCITSFSHLLLLLLLLSLCCCCWLQGWLRGPQQRVP